MYSLCVHIPVYACSYCCNLTAPLVGKFHNIMNFELWCGNKFVHAIKSMPNKYCYVGWHLVSVDYNFQRLLTPQRQHDWQAIICVEAPQILSSCYVYKQLRQKGRPKFSKQDRKKQLSGYKQCYACKHQSLEVSKYMSLALITCNKLDFRGKAPPTHFSKVVYAPAGIQEGALYSPYMWWKL